MNSEVVLYLIIFVVFAVVQGIGQRAKQRGRPAPNQPPGGDGPQERPRAPQSAGAPGAPGPDGPQASSEAMLPGEVWEEILGLARGEAKSPPSPMEPSPEDREIKIHRPPGSVEEIPSFEAQTMEDLAPRKQPDRSGTAKGLVRAAKKPPALAQPTVREGLFAAGTSEDLRKAVVLKEVLDPPVALRE